MFPYQIRWFLMLERFNTFWCYGSQDVRRQWWWGSMWIALGSDLTGDAWLHQHPPDKVCPKDLPFYPCYSYVPCLNPGRARAPPHTPAGLDTCITFLMPQSNASYHLNASLIRCQTPELIPTGNKGWSGGSRLKIPVHLCFPPIKTFQVGFLLPGTVYKIPWQLILCTMWVSLELLERKSKKWVKGRLCEVRFFVDRLFSYFTV